MPRNSKHFSRILFTRILLVATLAGIASAQSPLSKIQDVLFKADGARFRGTLVIRWSTFDANNLGTIIQQSRTVPVTNGNLQVQLAPNATAQPPANIYTVSYQSDGREQFTESWSVPASSLPLTVAQIRVGASRGGTGSGGTGSTDNSTPILESSVVGLQADLGQRPTRGPGFGTGAVAVINSSGQVETAVGALGDCVFVDGTSGPCGPPAQTFIDAEIPAGTMDGANAQFTLLNPPAGSGLSLYRNGVYLTAGVDYTLSGTAITFLNGAQPRTGDGLVASYRVDPAGNIGQLRQPQGPNVALAQVVCSTTGAAISTDAWVNMGGCDIPATSIRSGDRFEIRFNFNKSGRAAAWETFLTWGSTTILARQASAADSAFTGKAEAAITASGVQISVESYGTLLPFRPELVTAGRQQGLRVDFHAKLSAAGGDRLTLSNFTILRYPGN